MAVQQEQERGQMKSAEKRAKPEVGRTPTGRKYFELRVDMGLDTAPWRIWVNEATLTKGFQPRADMPFRGLQFSEPPKIAFERQNRRDQLLDAYPIWTASWLVSDRLKLLFERVDAEAFAFERAEVDHSNFSELGPAYWFCYIVRMLDCVDEEHSKIHYQDDIPFKNYLELVDIKMKPDVIGSARAFRLKYASLKNIVDDVLVTLMKKEGIRGFRFVNIQRS
jgi:hypothetical protein